MDILEEHLPNLLPKQAAPLPAHAMIGLPASTRDGRETTADPTISRPELADSGASAVQNPQLILQRVRQATKRARLFLISEFLDPHENLRKLEELGLSEEFGAPKLPKVPGLELRMETHEKMLQDILLELTPLIHELDHLSSHPEVFHRVEEANQFWKEALKMLAQARTLGRFSDRVDEFADKLKERLYELRWKHPRNAALTPADEEVILQPWQTWCRQLPLQGGYATVKAMKAKHPDMQLSTSQLLPVQGVLIAEHWRRKVEATVLAIVQSSSNPALAQTQMPNPYSLIADSRRWPNLTAVERDPTQNPPPTAKMRKLMAFGPQSHEASAARSMAFFARDITSRGNKAAMFMGAFFTPKGSEMWHDQEAWQVEEEKLYESRRK